jgi:hypothetical protein
VLLALALLTQGAIRLRDLPGTHGEWHEGEAVIPAPREQILFWLTDYRNWPRRFPDIGWANVLPDDKDGRHVIRFSSRTVNSVITIHEEVRPNLLVFEGTAPYVRTQGRIHLIDLGDGTTHVLMQSSSQVRGFWKIFATKGMKRDKAFKVMQADLQALYDLAVHGERGRDLTQGR